MEDESTQLVNSNVIEQGPKSRSKLFYIIIGVVLFIVFAIAGYFAFGYIDKERDIIYTTNQSPTSADIKLPDYLEPFSKDPAFSGWTAAVAGVLVKREGGKFTLDPIKDEYLPNGVHNTERISGAKPIEVFISLAVQPTFYIQKTSTPSGTLLPVINYNDIKEGSILRGSVGIYYQDNSMNFFGQSFVVSSQ